MTPLSSQQILDIVARDGYFFLDPDELESVRTNLEFLEGDFLEILDHSIIYLASEDDSPCTCVWNKSRYWVEKGNPRGFFFTISEIRSVPQNTTVKVVKSVVIQLQSLS